MTTGHLNINGKLVPESRSGLSVHNRAFKFGDGIFESIRVINGNPLFLEDHYSRLVRSLKILEMNTGPDWNQSLFRKRILSTIEANEIKQGGRIRFSAFRNGKGLYTPESNDLGYVIEARGGEPNEFILNRTGLRISIYDDIQLPINKLSQVKTNNCLPYIMAGLHCKRQGFDEVLLTNISGNLCEAGSSNIFLLIDGMLYTPSLEEGCVAGVMRKKVIQLCKKLNIPVLESSLSKNLLNEASEVILTNAISGTRWVQACGQKRYFHKTCERLNQALNELSA